LFDPAEFTRVIRQAYEAIRDCSCKAKGHDGCYRCIYTYTNQNVQEALSRSRAEKLFHKIVEKADAWEQYNTGLSMISGDGRIEESELEDRFIRSLRTYLNSDEMPGSRFEDFMQDGVMNYKFRITRGDVSYSYMIRPQYDLGPADGVAVHTRPDFYITLTSIVRNGVEDELPHGIDAYKSVAIYLDGYTYHATEQNFRFYDDLQKRQAVAASGNIISWSLTWADLERFDISKKENDSNRRTQRRDTLYMDRNDYRECIEVVKKIFGPRAVQEGLFDTENSMERLLWRLSCGMDEKEVEVATGRYLGCLRKSFAKATADASEIDSILERTEIELNADLKATKVDKGEFYVFPETQPESPFATLRLAVYFKDSRIKSLLSTGTQTGQFPKEDWELFWQVYNLVQEGGGD